MKISTKLILAFLVISLVPLVVISIRSYLSAKEALTQEVLNHLESVATIQRNRVESIVEQNLERLSLVSSRTQLRLSLESFIKDSKSEHQDKMNKILFDARSSISSFRDISILTLDGKTVASTDMARIGTKHFNEEVFIRGQRENSANTFFLDEDQSLSVYLSGPLYLESKLLGVVVIESNVDNIISLVKDYSGLGQTGETLLAKRDENGDALFLTPLRFDQHAALNRTVSQDNLSVAITQALLKNEQLLTNTIDYRGEPVLASTQYIEKTDWGLVTKIDKGEAFAPVVQLGNLLLTIILVSSALVMLVCLFAARAIGRPIVNLTRTATKISKGDLSQRAEVMSKDEIGILAQAFNQMTDRLIEDITERKQAEEALKRSNEFLKTALDSMNDAISIIDVHDFRIVGVNSGFLKQLGLKEEEVIGKPCYEITHHRSDPCTPPDDICPLRDTVTTGEHSVAEHVHYRADGERIYVEVSTSPIKDENGKTIQVIHVSRDITERKQAEKKLKQAAEEWGATFDSIVDLVSIHDKDFKIVRVNKACADALKMKPREVIGKTCYEVFHGTKEPPPYCPHKQTLETKKPHTAEFFEPHLGVYLEFSTSPIFNEKGEVTGSVHIVKDITERKQAEEKLIVTDRLASVGELASGIAHELNNPLTGVIGFSELLLEKDIPDEIREDIKIIYSEAQRTAEVVKGLLTFARRHPPVKQLVNITSIIEKVLELRAYEQRVSNIQVITNFASDLPEVMADYFQLQQVFLNIIINAEHFMIEAHNRGNLTITTERTGNIIKTSFADDGPGISKENLGHVFDPFFTTKEVGKGTGLGLSICHGIITEHGGRMYAESELGKGATFVVELPISDH
jgi:PAS domain S-box-containing protein